MSPPKIAAAVSLALCSSTAFAQSGTPVRDDPPPNLEKLSSQVEELAEIREKQRVTFLDSVRRQVLAAVQGSGTAGNYMIECMREVRFAGRKGGNVEYGDWKKDNRDLFTNSNFEKAASLHLKYLLLTLERGTKETSEPMMKKVWAHLDELNRERDLLGYVDRPRRAVKIRVVDQKQDVVSEMVGDMKQLQQPNVQGRSGPGEIRQYVEEMLNASVDSGFPGQALKLQGRMGNYENWSMIPGDFSAIIEENIRPFLRESADAKRLPWSWDYEINYLREIILTKKDEKELEVFDTEIYPRMLWKKAKDVALVGLPNKALTMQIDIAKQYSGHNDFESWTNEIETSLSALAEAKEAEEEAEEEELTTEGGKYDGQYDDAPSAYFGSTQNSGTPATTPQSLP